MNDHHHGQGEHEQAPIISYTYTVHLNPIATEFCPQQTIHIQAFSWATHVYSIDITQSCPKLYTLLVASYIYNHAVPDHKHHLVGWPQPVKSSNSLTTERLLEEVHG